MPLTVDVEERMYAAGKIPGGFFRREGRPSRDGHPDRRAGRPAAAPSFPKGCATRSVVATILSTDMQNLSDVLAINGASAAVPSWPGSFSGPVGAILGRRDNDWIVNPTYSELEECTFDAQVVAGRQERGRRGRHPHGRGRGDRAPPGSTWRRPAPPSRPRRRSGWPSSWPRPTSPPPAPSRASSSARSAPSPEYPLFHEYGEDVAGAIRAAVRPGPRGRRHRRQGR